jgi:hypothetical protein
MKSLHPTGLPLSSFSILLVCASIARADYTPLTLTPDSYNKDMVVENTAMHAPVNPALTTVTLDTGLGNSADTWYETGFNTGYPDSGLPVAGSIITSVSQSDHSYKFAASYATHDAVLIDATMTNATLVLTTPAPYSGLSFLGSSGGGGTAVRCVVHHTDGTTETGNLSVPDWFSGANQIQVLTANGRVNVDSLTFDNEGSGHPSLYALDLPLTNVASAVATIDLSFTAGGHAGFLALSGSSGAGFSPVAFAGYNCDMIVESNNYVVTPTPLNATTAAMGDGANNGAETWYEQGYNPAAPATGLPAPGAILASAANAQLRFQLAPSYTANNTALVDAGNSASLTPVTPIAGSTLSFLASSANGASTLDYLIAFQDGATESGSFVVPDWYGGEPYAFIADGRVTVGTGAFSSVGSGNPRLYTAQIQTAHAASPVTNIQLSLNSAGPSAHAAVLAVTIGSGSLPPNLVSQPASLKTYEGSNATFSVSVAGTAPLACRWMHGLNGTYAALSDGGNVTGSATTSLTLNPVALADAGNYLCVVTNTTGSVTSHVATLTVLSFLPDVVVLGDPLAIYGGHQAEPVANAIDHTTWKHLNFGLSPSSPPFIGPVGFIVTPALGPTRVTAVRIYTANDSPERDPADFTLEGSNDNGSNYTVIASGPLSLPDGRNINGLDLDPLSQYNQEVDFPNRGVYTTYRLSFTHVKSDALASSMQIAEAELLGVAAAPVAQLTISRSPNGTLTITSTLAGLLQSTSVLNGTSTVWHDERPITGSVEVTPSGVAIYFRVVTQP